MRGSSKGGFFTSIMVAAMTLGFAADAFAQAAPTCDPRVMDAMKATAEMRRAADVAQKEQLQPPPDSTQALTCLNQALGHSFTEASQIFSQGTLDDLRPVIEPGLEAMLQNNFEGSISVEQGIADMGSLSQLTAEFDCQLQQEVNDYIATAGINVQAPTITFDDVAAGAMPAGGEIYEENWASDASQQVVNDLQASLDALPVPTIPNFDNDQTLCDVLTTAGAGACP